MKQKKITYDYTGGDQYTRVRCSECDHKYTKEHNLNGCPNCNSKNIKKVKQETLVEPVHLGEIGTDEG